jgi:hypothetical protein
VTLRTAVALVLAFASTILISLAYLREHRAVGALPALELRYPLRSLGLLLGTRDWLVGFAMESAGFGLYVGALALADLAPVQGVAAGGVGVLAVASARVGHRPLSGRERAGAALAVAGLLGLAISLSGRHGEPAYGSTLAILVWLAGTALLAVLALRVGAARIGAAAANGVAGGLLFSAGDLCTKLATQGAVRFVFVVPMIAGYLLGTSFLQIGYQRGAALTIAGIATLLSNALPILAGSVLLAEPVPGGALGVLRVLAFVAVVAGAALLARPRPQATPVEAAAPRSARAFAPARSAR